MEFNDPPRPKPYIWPSWLTRLLSGEDLCWWKAWAKANFKVTKTPDDPDREDFFKEWNEKHDAITKRRADEFRAQGYDVRIEEEGQFKLRGVGADVAGKPDIVAIKDRHAIVTDAKSGKKRDSDHWQVLIYLFALPLTWGRGLFDDIRGEVEYTDGTVQVRVLGPVERQQIVDAIKKVTGPAPDAAPSAQECKYCDVAKCPVRFVAPPSDGDASRYF